MNAVVTTSIVGGGSTPSTPPPLPAPRCPISVRPAVPKDQPFIDHLQKMHTFMVGFLHHKAMEQKIAAGQVLVAEDSTKNPVGYCISQDQYSGRDDVGIIYQLNVAPLSQRQLIGATLIKEVFERAAYGCRLFSCWCAQDLQANFFWESIGFIPLAFRTGTRNRQRIHIYWQRRVREDDHITPYWFPSQTRGGAMTEERIVLPIPPGTHWRDAKPVVLPELPANVPGLTAPALPPARPAGEKKKFVPKVPVIAPPSKFLKETPPGKAAVVTGSGIRYVDRGDYVPPPEPEKPKREPKPRAKNDPKLVKAARELRDKYLEQLNRHALPCYGKYDVSRREALDLDLPQPRLLAG